MICVWKRSPFTLDSNELCPVIALIFQPVGIDQPRRIVVRIGNQAQIGQCVFVAALALQLAGITQPQPGLPQQVERGDRTEIHCLHAPLPPSQVPDILKLTNLVRLAFRRPLEAWLVLRLAVSLQAQGFAVTLRRFCAETVTPRNLLLSARA